MSKVAVCLLTCDRLAYTQETVHSFLRWNSQAPFVLLHGDDASDDRRVPRFARQGGFETVVQSEPGGRVGVTRMVEQLAAAVVGRGIDWMLLLENDWRWVWSFPWPLFEEARKLPGFRQLRLYGQFKEEGGRRPCGTRHRGTGEPANWQQWREAPEPAEVGSIHYGNPPSVVRARDVLDLARGAETEAQMMARSWVDGGLTVRPLKPRVYHIGFERTPRRACAV